MNPTPTPEPSEQTQSKTPRTDLFFGYHSPLNITSCLAYSRQLETELATVTDERDKLRDRNTKLLALVEDSGFANWLGSIDVEERKGFVSGDCLAVALATYFDGNIDKPERDEIEDSGSWTVWVEEKVREALKLVAKGILARITELKGVQ